MTNIVNLSVLIFVTFKSIPSVKVLGKFIDFLKFSSQYNCVCDVLNYASRSGNLENNIFLY